MRVAFSFLVVCVAACSEPQTSDSAQFPAYRIRGRWPRAPRITYYVDDGNSPVAPGELQRAVRAGHELWSTTGVEFIELETSDGADVEYVVYPEGTHLLPDIDFWPDVAAWFQRIGVVE